MEHLCQDERQIADDEDKERFHDRYVVRESGDEAAEQTEEDSNSNRTKNDDEEWSESGNDVDALDVFQANLAESFENVVQHLHEIHQQH